MSTPPEQKPFGDSAARKSLAPEFLSPNYLAGTTFTDEFCASGLADYISESILCNLPNDLTRMIYLASLRDCNSGLYLHPELSHQRGLHAADRAFRVCHEQVFRRYSQPRGAELRLPRRLFARDIENRRVLS